MKEDSNLITLWPVGAYLVGHKDNIIETQAIFKRDDYYSVGSKIISRIYEDKKRPKIIVLTSTYVMILNKDPKLNKCPLRIFLIATAQKLLNVLNNDKNTIFNMIINN
ncbi:10775_t:CDS:2 [Cetraspora pellucida]|uniref:10775_t:CDS:1 n=1 Tax=Cetraspora pellucida TaxID=1433469 RepID=A0A9N9IJT0_9GLOM|nr:10775_t:CDS:2 [Cetraspora pellucida]